MLENILELLRVPVSFPVFFYYRCLRREKQTSWLLIRKLLGEMYGGTLAKEIRIQYGGSVKPGSAAELMAQEDVDGLLVGGASLNADGFVAIIRAAA